MDKQNDLSGIRPAVSLDSKPEEEPSIVIGRDKIQASVVHSKILQDIAFLESKITQIKKSASPNSVMLKTYQDMLNSRQSVIGWLELHDMVDATHHEKTG